MSPANLVLQQQVRKVDVDVDGERNADRALASADALLVGDGGQISKVLRACRAPSAMQSRSRPLMICLDLLIEEGEDKGTVAAAASNIALLEAAPLVAVMDSDNSGLRGTCQRGPSSCAARVWTRKVGSTRMISAGA